jgi:O-antigen/teichoic acid export membrane protein
MMSKLKANLNYSIVGVLLNTLFPLITYPYLTRVLGVKGIGVYNYYNLAIGYLGLVAQFGIGFHGTKEIGRYRDNINKKAQITTELTILSLLNALFCYSLFCVYVLIFDERSKIPITLALILPATAISAEWFFTATENQKYIFFRSSIVKILSICAIFTFVKQQQDLYVYISIIAAMHIVTAVSNFTQLLKNIDIRLVKNINVVQYIKPIFFVFVAEICVRYFGMVDVVLLGNLSGKTAVGFYALALNVYSVVNSFLKVTAPVLLPRSAYLIEKKDDNGTRNLVCNTINFLLFIGIPCSIGLFIWADWIVKVLGGKEFIQSIFILKCFSFIIIPSAIANTIIFQLLYPLGRIKSIIYIYITGIIINIMINIVFIPRYSYYATVVAFMISNVFILIVLILFEHSIFPQPLLSIKSGKYIFAGLLLFVSLSIAKNYLNENLIIIQFLIGGATYIITLLITKEYLLISGMQGIIRKWKK